MLRKLRDCSLARKKRRPVGRLQTIGEVSMKKLQYTPIRGGERRAVEILLHNIKFRMRHSVAPLLSATGTSTTWTTPSGLERKYGGGNEPASNLLQAIIAKIPLTDRSPIFDNTPSKVSLGGAPQTGFMQLLGRAHGCLVPRNGVHQGTMHPPASTT